MKDTEADRREGETGPSPEPGDTDLRIGRSLGLRTTQLGSAFEREHRSLMWQRARLVLAIGLVVSALLYALTLWVPLNAPVTRLAAPEWKAWADLLYPVSFALGLAYVHWGRPGITALQVTVLLVAALNLVAGLTEVSLTQPDVLPGFGVALVLFIPAAFIPWKAPYQVALSVLAVVSSIVTLTLAYLLVPEVRAFWEQGAARPFGEQLFLSGVGSALLGATSVFVTRTLYGLRKTAFRARRLGNYVLHKEIGEGGMGRVYVAEHALMCRPSAVKVLKAATGADRTALARFEREVRLSASLSHPNTITIFDFGRAAEDTFYYAMEYLEGMDLERFVERFGPIPASRAVFLLLQVTGPLAEAHHRAIVHRDLKPSNIFLTMRGGLYDFVKVLDFGLAKRIEGADTPSELTKTGVVFGTPRYLAPETVYGTAGVGSRADIYALGAVAYWMLTGRPPFTADSAVALMIDHVKTVPPRPSEICEVPIPAELDDAVMKCLEKDPDDRFQSIAELEIALRAVPDPSPWTRGRAARWWDLHMTDDEVVRDCFCPPVEEIARDGDDYSALSAAGVE